MPRRVAFHTFGCKLNQYETEALAAAFRAAGFLVAAGAADADVHVVNTCTVTSRADHKARTLIRGLSRANPRGPVLVTGCSAQTEAEALSELGQNVVVVRQSEKSRILGVPSLLARSVEAGAAVLGQLRDSLAAGALADPFGLVADRYSFHTRAFLKIQDGCDCRCAYCRVPFARGPSTSLGLEEVIRRAASLQAAGHREIVLTGVNISAWSSGGASLPQLLERLLADPGPARYRLSSLEPERITDELAEVLSDHRICPHFHIPVQSGSDAVLARMRRRYRSERIRQALARLKKVRDDPFVAADMIAGFPGESAEDHERTLSLVRELGFASLHVFPFSSRPSTEAAAMTPVVPDRIRRERASELSALSRELYAAYVRRWAGREVAVLLQSSSAGGWRGVSENYLTVQVVGMPADAAVRGSVIRARLIEPGERAKAEFISRDG